jgi:hypothetical protein
LRTISYNLAYLAKFSPPRNNTPFVITIKVFEGLRTLFDREIIVTPFAGRLFATYSPAAFSYVLYHRRRAADWTVYSLVTSVPWPVDSLPQV